MHESLQKAVTRVLLPLARLLLRHGVSHAEFCNWAKQAYIQEAGEHFGIDGKAPTVSRIAIVTGINRKEVKRIRELPDAVDTGVSKHNRAVRVVTGWLQDSRFNDSRGRPRVLKYGEADDSFNQLVRHYGGDVPARALLDELVRVGTVKNNDGKIRLLQKGYVPQQSGADMLEMFSSSASDLLNTLDHNLANPENNRLQLSVAYDRVSTKGVTAFRKASSEQALQLLRTLDTLLSQHDGDANPERDGDGEHRIGLGIYVIGDICTEEQRDE
ncbi:MAG: DUF6502 family protein [Granulosicoccus sp.]